MGPLRPKRTPFSTPPSLPEEGLVTSEDLFGDLVDEAPSVDNSRKGARSNPIRVRVKEQGQPEGPGPAEGGSADVLPPDVAALLDAFSGPAEAAVRTEATRETVDAFLDAMAEGDKSTPPASGARMSAVEALGEEPRHPGALDTLLSEEDVEISLDGDGLTEETPVPSPTMEIEGVFGLSGSEMPFEERLALSRDGDAVASGESEIDLLDADPVPPEPEPAVPDEPQALLAEDDLGLEGEPGELLDPTDLVPARAEPLKAPTAPSPGADEGFLDPRDLVPEGADGVPESSGNFIDPKALVPEGLEGADEASLSESAEGLLEAVDLDSDDEMPIEARGSSAREGFLDASDLLGADDLGRDEIPVAIDPEPTDPLDAGLSAEAFLDPSDLVADGAEALLEESAIPEMGGVLDPLGVAADTGVMWGKDLPASQPAVQGEVDDLLEGLSADDLPPPKPTGPKTTAVSAPQAGAPVEPKESSLDLAALAEDAFAETTGGPLDREYGPYRLVEKVAVGGMAEVFRAKRAGVEGFEKVVAVKRILPHLSDNKEFVDMFINEAKMVAGLTHPNIVQIFDLGKILKSYYIAMEYVHGRDLRSIQKRAKDKSLRIPLDISCLIVSRICLALEYAHRKKDESGRPMKIVHRDVSPQNVLISYEGEVKLTDFGIAKAATKAPSTDVGALRGKLLYMSPEQAWGRPIDRRSDLFSLGIILYELITEQKPFLGNSEVNILELVRECRVSPPRKVNPRIPEKLEQVVMKALAREPDERYQDAGEMVRELERAVPDRAFPGGTELARFMEILFEDEQRGRQALPEPPAVSQTLDIEFDVPSAENPPAKPSVSTDPLSIEKLLARFGIK